MTSVIRCCKGCTVETGRSAIPNCHMTCEKYLKEKAINDEILLNQKKVNMNYIKSSSYQLGDVPLSHKYFDVHHKKK